MVNKRLIFGCDISVLILLFIICIIEITTESSTTINDFVVFNEPIFKPEKVFVKGGEAFLFVIERPQFSNRYDSGNEKTFVNIDATAYGVNDFHGNCPPFIFEGRHCLPMPSRNDKSMPMISVRSRRSTYLCLNGMACTV